MRTKRQVRNYLNSISELIDRYNTMIDTSRTQLEVQMWEASKNQAIAKRDVLRWVLKEVD